MRRISEIACVAFLGLMLSGCAMSAGGEIPPVSSPNTLMPAYRSVTPAWVYAPADPGKVCAVGVALPHVKGLPSQRATAISRAIEDISRQQQVEVTGVLEAITSGSQTGAQSRLSSYSIQTTDSTKVINATVTDTWMDETTHEFYVRMCTQ